MLGIGYGIYTAVDFAMITEVLPSADDRAKDLGVINIANALPQVLAPVVAAGVLGLGFGYSTLYVVAAAVSVLGSVLVVNIKSAWPLTGSAAGTALPTWTRLAASGRRRPEPERGEDVVRRSRAAAASRACTSSGVGTTAPLGQGEVRDDGVERGGRPDHLGEGAAQAVRDPAEDAHRLGREVRSRRSGNRAGSPST